MKKLLFLLLFLSPMLLIFAAPIEEKKSGAVSANEDLMREHGVLNRLLLIYQEIATRIDNYQQFPIDALSQTAQLVRNFVEDYHEKLEEEYIFPHFEKLGKLTPLIETLRAQHQAGRKLTDYILEHAKQTELHGDIQKLMIADYLNLYVRMFRPHEAREDTIVFPEFKKLITPKEYDELGDLFEEKEHQLFGEDGFNKIVADVAKIEISLGIYNLSQFTPSFPKEKEASAVH